MTIDQRCNHSSNGGHSTGVDMISKSMLMRAPTERLTTLDTGNGVLYIRDCFGHLIKIAGYKRDVHNHIFLPYGFIPSQL